MKVLMISKALVNGAYHKKIEELSAYRDIQLTLIVPERWADIALEKRQSDNYKVVPSRIIFNGYNHFHCYPSISGLFKDIRPDIVHIDEEHYSFITFQAMRLAKKFGAKAIFFTWQNIYKKYPPPFSWIEKYNLRHADFAIAGNQEAKNILFQKGFNKEVEVIPQFGIDPKIFKKDDVENLKKELNPEDKFIIGFAGRLVREKGIIDLLDAVLNIELDSHLFIIGAGPLKNKIIERAKGAGISQRVKIIDPVPSFEIYKYFNCMDCLALPSLTTSNWKEQFGRVLIEAMACEVPVIGSNSGEIPNVIGDAGLIFKEGNISDLASKIRLLRNNDALRIELGRKGRQRVLEHFTQKIVAEKTYEVYKTLTPISP